jgi:hypothetical protein
MLDNWEIRSLACDNSPLGLSNEVRSTFTLWTLSGQLSGRARRILECEARIGGSRVDFLVNYFLPCSLDLTLQTHSHHELGDIERSSRVHNSQGTMWAFTWSLLVLIGHLYLSGILEGLLLIGHQQDMCYDEMECRAQNIDTILGYIVKWLSRSLMWSLEAKEIVHRLFMLWPLTTIASQLRRIPLWAYEA